MMAIALLNAATFFLVANAPLTKYSSAFYDIESDLPPQRVQQLGTIMDAAGKEYDRRFSGYSGKVRQRLKLKVYATREEYVEAVKRAADGSKADGTAGVFIHNDETVYTYDSPHMEHVLRHECFHQFTHFVVGGNLDPWVNEGLAEYFGVAQVDPSSGTLVLGKLDRHLVTALAEARERGGLFSVDEVLTISGRGWHENMGSENAGTQYAQAWALCHFLIHADGGKYQRLFDDYLRLIDKHLDGASAFKRIFGEDTKPLQERYGAYLDSLISTLASDKSQNSRQHTSKGG